MTKSNEVLSHKTAIARSGPSSPLKLIEPMLSKNSIILDYGCGRGDDVKHLRKEGYSIDGYDPHWKDVDLSSKNNFYDIVLCTYVLNVLPEGHEDDLLLDIKDKLKDSGVAYITVRRDSFKEGYTSRGFQRKVFLDKTASFLKNSSFETYALSKK